MPHWLSVSTAAITTINRALFKAAVWIMAVVVPVMLYQIREKPRRSGRGWIALAA